MSEKAYPKMRPILHISRGYSPRIKHVAYRDVRETQTHRDVHGLKPFANQSVRHKILVPKERVPGFFFPKESRQSQPLIGSPEGLALLIELPPQLIVGAACLGMHFTARHF